MDRELYLRLMNAFDDMLDWAIMNNKSYASKEEKDQANADKTQEMLVKYDLCVVDLEAI